MTANQINHAAQQETARHNVAVEELEARKNDIDEEHYQRMDAINSTYNDRYLELQKSQGDEKLRIQAELADLEQSKALELQHYHAMTTALEQDKLKLQDRSQDWLENYQSHMISLGYSEQYAKMYAAMVQNKKVEYDKHYQDEMIRIQDYNALANWTKLQNEYELGRMQNYINMKTAASQMSLNEYKAGTEFANSIFNGIKILGGTLMPFSFMK